MKTFQERDPYVSRKLLCLQYAQLNTISWRLTGVQLYFHTFVTLIFVEGQLHILFDLTPSRPCRGSGPC